MALVIWKPKVCNWTIITATLPEGTICQVSYMMANYIHSTLKDNSIFWWEQITITLLLPPPKFNCWLLQCKFSQMHSLLECQIYFDLNKTV